MKDTTPMSSGSAREMRRVLEQIKDFARYSKLAYPTEELSSQSTLDLIEQKLFNHIVQNFCRWVNKENKDKAVTVDLLVACLQDETELEERLQAKLQTIYEKPRTLLSINYVPISVNFVNCAINLAIDLLIALYS